MLIELHLLTSHAPANLNRDDFGRPKTALFGGTERARVSSQSQKRAIRFAPPVLLICKPSDRSKEYPLFFYDRLCKSLDPMDPKRLQDLCEFFAECVGSATAVSKTDNRKLKTDQAILLTHEEVARIEAVLSQCYIQNINPRTSDNKAKKAQQKFLVELGLNNKPSDAIDLALFGRMTTDEANLFAAVDASTQVAHPIATHTTITETDYFTTVDDLAPRRGERGAAHVDEFDFNSALFYKYFSCDFGKLMENLGGKRDTATDSIIAMFDAACRVTPSGKQNSCASHSQADVALLVVREQNIPCSLANAFERPVPDTTDGYLETSTRRLVERYCRLVHGYDFEDRAILFTLEEFELRLKDTLRVVYNQVSRTDRLNDLWKFLRQQALPRSGAGVPVEG
jgi:CRISPR system Cascade subunit CasC